LNFGIRATSHYFQFFSPTAHFPRRLSYPFSVRLGGDFGGGARLPPLFLPFLADDD
jgi:hypothetical protein